MAQPNQGTQQGQQSQQGQQGVQRGRESGQGTSFTGNQEIAQAMKGIDFPATREDLLNQAKQNGASQNIIGRLRELPDEEFGNAAQVLEVVGQRD